MASDLPRIRVHDDGAVALHYPKAGARGDWMVIPAETVLVHWGIDKDVTGPGWRDAVIVPLPEPTGTHPRTGNPRWSWDNGHVGYIGGFEGAVGRWRPGVQICADAIWTVGETRRAAAALLAAADYLDQAKAVTTDAD